MSNSRTRPKPTSQTATRKAVRLAPRGVGRGLLGGLGFFACMALAFPPIQLWWFALVALAPLAWAAAPAAASSTPGGARAPLWGPVLGAFLGTLPFWTLSHHWVWWFAPPGAVGLALHLAVFPAWFVWIVRRLWTRLPRWGWWASLPIIWVGMEMFRGAVTWSGYPWFFVGHPMIEWPWGASAARVVGGIGISLFVASIGAGLAACATGERRTGAVMVTAAAAAWLALAVLSSHDASTDQGRQIRLAAIQTDVSLGVRQRWGGLRKLADLERFVELSELAANDAAGSPDLIAWPETLFPGLALQSDAVRAEREANLYWFEVPEPGERTTFTKLFWRSATGEADDTPFTHPLPTRESRVAIPTTVPIDTLLHWQRALHVPMLVGNDGLERLRFTSKEGAIRTDFDARYNSVFLIERGRVADVRYDKQHLTPFGEVMPIIEHWPWLEERLITLGIGASGMTFDLDRGDARTVFEVPARDPADPPIRVVTPVCFEATMSGVCRHLAYHQGSRRADAIVQITNDSWFGHWNPGRRAHAQLARWRAVELGIPLVRSANTGVSGVWDARGREVDSLDPGGDGVVIGSAAPTRPTLYGRIVGDSVGWVCVAGLAIACIGAILPKRGTRSGAPQTSGV